MCGLVGVLQKNIKPEVWVRVLTSMREDLRHRGPDDAGLWYDAEVGVGLGHQRLSILDLSPLGHQPMASKSRRYYIVYNGEIYNFILLKRELQSKGHEFTGNSDTEVVLASIEEWGLKQAVERFNGMFAIAVWDRKERLLHLVRDRLGIKPIYFGWTANAFIFCSELKPFKLHPEFEGQVDKNALSLLMRHNYIPAPYSIYKGVFKLMPGTILKIDPEHKHEIPDPEPYWCAKNVVENGCSNLFSGTPQEAVDELDVILRDAVKLRMISDVPLGAFLSGGIDSSTVVALMQAQSERPVKTFSIGFREDGYNEAVYAKKVAKHLGTEHTELYVTPEQAMAVIPKIPIYYNEPFSDSSQIPTFLVSELTRQYVTVSLSGDGGDELFCGYNRYERCQKIHQLFKMLTPLGRQVTGKLLSKTPTKMLDYGFGWLKSTLDTNGSAESVGDKLKKLAKILASDNSALLYLRLISHWQEPNILVNNAHEPETALVKSSSCLDLGNLKKKMMYWDLISYLPDDILTKVDRASMAVSLEARVPILDHRVVAFAWKVPLEMKVRDGKRKWLLRQLLYRYVPSDLIDRPKMGFGIPIGEWLRGPLRDWAEELLRESRLKDEGFFNPVPIRKAWSEHLSRERNWQYQLWDVLMFQAWLNHK